MQKLEKFSLDSHVQTELGLQYLNDDECLGFSKKIGKNLLNHDIFS